MRVDIKDCVASVECSPYIAGYTSDGDTYIADSYYVTVMRKDGKRWIHNVIFKGCIVDEDKYTCERQFLDVRKSALNSVNILLDRIIKRGYIDDSCWNEDRPVYGSEYYCKVSGV